MRGTHFFGRFMARHTSYYIYPNEVEMIARHAADISRIVGANPSVIELGPGSELSVSQKTLPLLRVLNPVSYIPVDCAESYLDGAVVTVRRILPDIKIMPECCNFYDTYFAFEHLENPLGCMWSSTISNAPLDGTLLALPRAHIIHMLRCFRVLLGSKSWLTLTVDSNQDEDSILGSYDSQDLADFMQNLIHLIIRDLPTTGLDPNCFVYEPVWHAEHHLLAHTLRVLKDHSFLIGAQSYSVQKGQSLCLATSFKYPLSLFCSMAREAGFESREVFPDDQNRVSLHLLRAI
ncbi:MAG: L-histidine N(alpha)-methyltransferase [Alphaproteobacteria bacterium]|nr:MAG: L-histidine N(alpha)-methyltransferase [Alphaproteobacteria bacterium]